MHSVFRFLLAATACGSLFLIAADLPAQSLWQQRDSRKAFLFQDLKARCVGDILTIAIEEETDVANSDTRGMSKQTASSANAGFAYAGNPSSGSASAQFNVNSDREFDGDVNFSSDRQFQDRFSVTVVDVLPNGNLVVAGVRNVLVEGDQKRLSVSGIVRSHDIRADNSVQSSNVAELRILYEGAGPESHFTNQGWLGRRVNKFWPF